MANKTDYLKLDKPNVNSNNWGTAINNNFELIDANAKSVKNSINRIQNTLGEANMIGFDENYQYVSFNIDSNRVATVTFFPTATSDGVKYYDSGRGVDNLSSFADYTGFYIKTDFTAVVDDTSPLPDFFKKEWHIGEIAVKNTVWDEIEVTNKIDFIKFKQSLGGWYLPILVGQDEDGNATNTITWQKKFAETAGEKTTTPIPFRTLNSSVFIQSFDSVTAGMEWTSDAFINFCDLIAGDGDIRNLFIDFFSCDDQQITSCPISIDYNIRNDGVVSGGVMIFIIFNAAVTEKFFMRARIMRTEA